MSRRGSPTAAEELKRSRKNPRRGNTNVTYVEESSPLDELDPTVGQDDDDSLVAPPSSDEEDETESDFEVETSRRSMRRATRNTSMNENPLAELRVSSRSNKSQANYEDVSGDDNSDNEFQLDEKQSTASSSTNPSYSATTTDKTPARNPKQRRSSIESLEESSEYEVEDDPGSSEESKGKDKENVAQKEFEPFKIQKIIATRREPRSVWMKLCEHKNTSALDFGSRWVQDSVQNETTVEERFMVKWDDLSYMHCSWETRKDLLEFIKNAKSAFSTFEQKSADGSFLFTSDERCDGDHFDPAWIEIDRVLEVHFPDDCPCQSVEDDADLSNEDLGIVLDMKDPGYENGLGRQFLIKWGNQPYSEVSYEFERDLILNDIEYKRQLKAFYKRTTCNGSKEAQDLQSAGEAEFRRLYKEVFGDKSNTKLQDGVKAYQCALQEDIYKNGGLLRDYQAEGVAWMMSNFINNRSSILADEMGLGKTIQLAAFINILATKLQRRGPFLVIVPLSTLGNWKNELDGWVDLNTIVYHGTAKDRLMLRQLEMAHPSMRPKQVRSNGLYLKRCLANATSCKESNPWMAEVVLTTPEMLCTDDYTELTSVKWEVVVVDEAHRLKNHKSKFAANLRDKKFEFGHRVLLTGTPIQNTMEELFALLNFVAPDLFDDCEDFMQKYGEMKSKESIDELHEEIRPYILRRLKEDVEKSVPPKEETLIEVELTVAQKQYYRALYEKNVKFLHKNKKKALDGPSLNNLAMQLRKCCNHLFLLNGIEEEFRTKQLAEGKEQSEGDMLVEASGKLVLLDKLLPRLKENGHRILIFSQFKIMLDVLEDYLDDREFKFERIDGSITGSRRQQAIDRFQAKEVAEGKEHPFVMLLSTRAGGVGINLTAADTCIIFDSDWNPQNDLQAQARCHRIGQTKSVKVYRLLTRKTYEMQMFHMSSLKMGLDQAVLSGFEVGSSGEGALTKEEIERLLRHGAYDLFSEDKNGSSEAESNAFVQQDIDTILERRSKVVVYENTGSRSSAAGGTFSKASFVSAKIPGQEEMDVNIEDPDFWKKMVGEGPEEEEKEDLPGKRNRTVSNYCEAEYGKGLAASFMESESEDNTSNVNQDDDSFEQGEESESEDDDEDLFNDSMMASRAPVAAASYPPQVVDKAKPQDPPGLPPSH